MLNPASGKAGGGSEYVNIGTPEETLLETYFVTLSKFNFDRAREQCVSVIKLHQNHARLITFCLLKLRIVNVKIKDQEVAQIGVSSCHC